MMKKDKILLCIQNLSDLEDYEKLGVTNFLFPLKDYSIGYTTFSFDEIEKTDRKAYILVNRLLTDDEIDEFLKLTVPKNVIGFIIEDTGLYVVLKDRGYTLINYQNHLNANWKTVCYWLDHFDSSIISTDITEDEIVTIVDKATKPLVLYAFGYPMIMYSRRNLVSNYYDNFALDPKREVTLNDPKGEFSFRLKETEGGTACFDDKILDTRSLIEKLPDEKIMFYLVNTEHIDKSDVNKAILGEKVANTTRGFLDKATVYRIGDLK